MRRRQTKSNSRSICAPTVLKERIAWQSERIEVAAGRNISRGTGVLSNRKPDKKAELARIHPLPARYLRWCCSHRSLTYRATSYGAALAAPCVVTRARPSILGGRAHWLHAVS